MKISLPLLVIAVLFQFQFLFAQKDLPHLQKVGDQYQLVIEGEPFIMLAGELGNSTATTAESMGPVWSRLRELNLNTVLVPIYWELLEPEEGKFDYHLLEYLIREARENNMKLVLLWFGAWKNSMSSHAPAWVKLDQKRFPRARSEAGGKPGDPISFFRNYP